MHHNRILCCSPTGISWQEYNFNCCFYFDSKLKGSNQYFWLSLHTISISEWICPNYQYFWLYLSVLSVLLTGSVPTISISDCLSILSVFLNGSVSTISISDWICTYYQYFWLSVHPTKETKVGRKCWLNKYNDSRTCWSKSLRPKTTSDFENVAVRVCDHVDVANITFENSDHIRSNHTF